MTFLKLKIKAQLAKPGAPLGPILGQTGIPIKPFLDDVNKKTSNFIKGLPLKIYVIKLSDKNYDIKIKGPLLSFLLKFLMKNYSLLNLYKIVIIKNNYNSIIFNKKKNEKETLKNLINTIKNNKNSK